jgi:hypothetical protein
MLDYFLSNFGGSMLDRVQKTPTIRTKITRIRQGVGFDS